MLRHPRTSPSTAANCYLVGVNRPFPAEPYAATSILTATTMESSLSFPKDAPPLELGSDDDDFDVPSFLK